MIEARVAKAACGSTVKPLIKQVLLIPLSKESGDPVRKEEFSPQNHSHIGSMVAVEKEQEINWIESFQT